MSSDTTLTLKDLRRVARQTIEVLAKRNYKCCVIGGLACTLWGMEEWRYITDVDIVVLDNYADPEEIKDYIVNHHDRFTLEPGKKRDKLWFNLHWGRGLKCKVDIIVTGRHTELQIPKMPKYHIVYPNNYDIPVAPFPVLLILKVQGWRDRILKSYWNKVARDRGDINRLLEMTDDNDHLDYFRRYPKWFLRNAEELVRLYTGRYPKKSSSFRQLGFDV